MCVWGAWGPVNVIGSCTPLPLTQYMRPVNCSFPIHASHTHTEGVILKEGDELPVAEVIQGCHSVMVFSRRSCDVRGGGGTRTVSLWV